jgi:peptidoglycan/LPS O-acetylase OafA/YrhL
MSEQSSRIPSLDGLRAISILLVIVSHAVFTKNAMVPSGIAYRWFDSLGTLGVRVFFVISGFLITNLLLKELDSKKTIRLTRFYFRRTLRIFVPYYSFLLFVILLETLGWIRLAPGDISHAFTYTMNYYPDRSWNVGHAWSLSVEEQFYLLWPAVLLLLGRRRGLWAAFGFMLIVPLIRFGYYNFTSIPKVEILYRFETSADAIAAGCLLAGLQGWLKKQAFFLRGLRSRLLLLVPLAVLVAAELDQHRQAYFLGISAQNIGIAVCLAWAVMNYSGRIGRVLNAKPLVFLGTISYSVYLWQEIFLNPVSSSIFDSVPVNLLLIGLTAVAAHYLIERPSFRLRSRLERILFAHPSPIATRVIGGRQPEEQFTLEPYGGVEENRTSKAPVRQESQD